MWAMKHEFLQKAVAIADENYDVWKKDQARKTELAAKLYEELIKQTPAIIEKSTESVELAAEVAEKVVAGVITGGISTVIPSQTKDF